MEKRNEKSNRISIYLIKSGNDINSLLKDNIKATELIKSEKSITYYVESTPSYPYWLKSYFCIDDNVALIQSNVKVISFHKLKIGNKEVIFAIPFGNGKSLLKSDVVEDQFGLKILLNSIDVKSFRQIQTVNCCKNFKTSSEQVPKISSLDEFVFDINSDLMRKAVAKCEDEEFCGNMITGGDVISVNLPYNKDTIEEFLLFCYKRYNEKRYLKNFDWIDNIKEVKSKSTIDSLNEELIKKINTKEFDKVWMAVPENIEWEKVHCFKFYKRDVGMDDINIEEFIKKFTNEKVENFNQLKNRNITAFSSINEEVYSWSVHKCIMAEIDFNGEEYCFNGGKWYKVNNDFANKINEGYNKIPIFEKQFPKCQGLTEKQYNILLHQQLQGSYLMDCEMVKSGIPGHSDIELCDVLTSNKELIHVKKGESSSYLSHLFNQARVSSDFIQDPVFRENANDKIGVKYFDKNFERKDYTIVLAIITKKEQDRPKIPFFSKVTIQYAISDLMRKGYTVKIKNIKGE